MTTMRETGTAGKKMNNIMLPCSPGPLHQSGKTWILPCPSHSLSWKRMDKRLRDGVTLKKPCLISNPSPRKILDIKWDHRVCQLTGCIHQAPTYSSFFPWVPQDLLWHQVMEQSSALDKSLEQCWIYSIIHTIQIFIVHFKKHNNI